MVKKMGKKTVAKVKKVSRKTIDRNSLKEWREAVYDRAGHKCEYCGSVEHLNPHHIFGRRNYATRYDLDNGCCLCSGCHTMRNTFSAHQTPLLFSDWIRERRGDEWFDALRVRANTPRKK